MSLFPNSIASFLGFTPSHTLSEDQHAAQHNSEQAEIIATQTKMGTGASTPISGTVLRGNGTGTSVWSQVNIGTDVSGILPIVNGGTGAASAAAAQINLGVYSTAQVDASIQTAILAAKQALYQVGSIYIETTGINPGTTLGFGTWTAYGAGQTLIGVGTSDQVFAAGATGGESNHTLSAAESGLPAHFHPYKFGGTAGGDGSAIATASTAGTQNNQTAILNVSAASASSSHNNLSPYIVTYFWKRTA